MESAHTNATILDRRAVDDGYAVLRVRPDQLPIPSFLPGQFVQLGLPEVVPDRADPSASRVRIAKRSYSIASSALARDGYELFVALVAEGRLTPRLWRIPVGGRCWLDARPLGGFTLEGVPADRDLVMVATGTGLSPYLSMLRTHPLDPPWRRFVLIHGVRHRAALAYEEELRARERDDARFRYVPVLSGEPGMWNGARGHVQVALEDAAFPELAGFALDASTCDVFLCGRPDMIRSARERLGPLGFFPRSGEVRGNLHFEKYW